MLESELRHNKTGTNNVKVAKMMEFIKTCDQYPRKFNFGHLFSSIILPLSAGENRFSKTVLCGKMGRFLLPGMVMIKSWRRVLLRA